MCSRKGTLYELCMPIPVLGKQCPCKSHFRGSLCDECSLNFYGYPNCRCKCHNFFVKEGAVDISKAWFPLRFIFFRIALTRVNHVLHRVPANVSTENIF